MKKIILGLFLILGAVSFAVPKYVNTTKIKSAGYEITTDDVNILQNTNLATIIHFTCNNCKTEHIATFMKGMGISQKVPMNTDLTAKEVNKFSQMGKISLQEVLNLYKYLKENHTESN